MHGLAEEMRQAGRKVNKSFAPLQPAVLTAEGRLEGRARLPAVHRALPPFVTYFASGKLGPPRKHMRRFIMGGGQHKR